MKIITVVALILVVGGGLWWWLTQRNVISQTESIHYHAGFVLFNNGQKQDFSDLKYMEVKPCGEEALTEKTPEEIQLEKAHLHDGVGDVVHVHREGAVWGDLFNNIDVELGASVAAYINNQSVENVLNYPITAYDSVVFIEGEGIATEDALKEAVTKDHIVTTEQRSENCGV